MVTDSLVIVIGIIVMSSNGISNAFIYAFFNANFRKAFKAALGCSRALCHLRNRNKDSNFENEKYCSGFGSKQNDLDGAVVLTNFNSEHLTALS